MELTGRYNLENGFHENQMTGGSVYENEQFYSVAFDACKEHFAETITTLFQNYQYECIEQVEDLFLAVLYEKENKKLYLFTDITTSPLNLYYTVSEKELFYSTSLKKLLLHSGIKRKMDMRAAKIFTHNGYICGNRTLIEGVKKLAFGEILEAGVDTFQIKQYPYSLKTRTVEEAKSIYMQTIKESIEEHISQEEEVYMPLSGGYDSNCILANIRQFNQKTVHAFTVGSKNGTNEIPIVEKIVDQEPNIILKSQEVSKDLFDRFPDIIWRLDGCTYESGVFLQYALANMVHQWGGKKLLCGESNNEIQNEKYYEDLQNVLKGNITETHILSYSENPFVATNLMILKKSSIMLNSFGIVGLYPYKNKKVVEISNTLKDVNGSQRTIFKQECKKIIEDERINLMKSLGGTTGIRSVLSENDRNRIAKITSQNALIQKVRHQKVKLYYPESILKRKAREVVHYIRKTFLKKQADPDETCIRELYLMIFNELFITGKYDSNFEDSQISIKTSDLI